MVSHYRRRVQLQRRGNKPVDNEVDAIQYTGDNFAHCLQFCFTLDTKRVLDINGAGDIDRILHSKSIIIVPTYKEAQVAEVGDYIVRGETGSYCRLSKQEFEKEFELDN